MNLSPLPLNFRRAAGKARRGLAYLAVAGSALAAAADSAQAQPPSDADLLDIMATELERNLSLLPKDPAPAHYLSYEITRQTNQVVYSAFGKGQAAPKNSWTNLDIDLRVGTPELDSSRARGVADGAYSSREIPVGDAESLAPVLWFQTGRAYRAALKQFSDARYRADINVAKTDKSGDFSHAGPQDFIGAGTPVELDAGAWLDRLNQHGEIFADYPELLSGRARLNLGETRRWYVNSESTGLATHDSRATLSISAQLRAKDGDFLYRTINFSVFRPEDLPDDSIISAAVQQVIQDVLALRDAPLMDPYSGPAILSGEASAVFFHEILGHRLEGHRLKQEEDGQTFRNRVDSALLPESFSVIFDPTVASLGGTQLMGHYLYDNEGIAARRVPVIEAGILKRFLMSRSPIDGFPQSNGHGRKQVGRGAVSRQSNLLVEVSDPLTNEELFQKLVELVQSEGTEYGLFFDVITGGFTLTGRYLPNAFNVSPVMVYKVYADGSRQLVRGVELIGTPLAALSEIIAADDSPATFNGYCGAESGSVPVSASSPAVLLKKIEVQRKGKAQVRPPLLPSPTQDGGQNGA